MQNNLTCCPYFKACCFFGLGVLAGLGLAAAWRNDPAAIAQEQTPGSAEQRVRELKLEFPAVAKPTNTLVNAVRVGDMLYVSGTGPGKGVVGRLGETMDVKQGRAAARQVGVQILAVVKAEAGSLDKVRRMVKTLGMVNAAPGFTDHPQVINGFSDLMVEVFGPEHGKGTRSAVGMSSLPGGIPVEIECIFELKK